MQPLIKYLLGEPHLAGKRLVNSQKSFRAEDIDEVGDNRHDTFFEMLGNWSFGEYFKEEQLPWIFEFLTKIVGLNPQRIYVTVFAGDKENGIPRDDESVAIWQRLFQDKGLGAEAVELITEERGGDLGMQGGRIFYYKTKNWWSRAGAPAKMPAREPGGPDSEIFYEFSNVEHNPAFGKYCHPNCDCGRFVEIGNSVFMEYKKNEDGTFSKLAQRNVDFGGGLERIVAASNDNPNIFTIDVFAPLVSHIRAAGNASNARSEQIVADHVRASVFLIGDGVTPSNKDRGYILRRLIRRAVTHGHYLIGLPTGFLSTLIDTVITSYEDAYPDLKQNGGMIHETFEHEQAAFERTYANGIKEFEKILTKKEMISGEDAFSLLATHGFPLELTEELAARSGKTVDREAFAKEVERHQEISRAGAGAKFGGHGLYLKTGEVTIRDESEVEKVTRLHTATHLLHAGLRAVLGPEVRQDGSDITVERTRFDFRFPRKVAPEELKKVEDWVQEAIRRDLAVECEEMPYAKAIEKGALGFFREKYPPRVKVYSVLNQETGEAVSRELCGGPHVVHTAAIGAFSIIKEESSSAGVRRIRAVVSP
jgi:alanyl-tRNA synthetase